MEKDVKETRKEDSIMKIVNAGYRICTPINPEEVMKHIEMCGRTCYQSGDLAKEGSAERFIHNIIKRGHESVLEHAGFTVEFTVDKGISHELVRHRLAAFSQSSTRYCNFSKDKFGHEITVIKPCFFNEHSKEYLEWIHSCEAAEKSYFSLLDFGCSPEEARSVLPNSLKTNLVVTCNIREWRHILKLRTAKAAHPQCREVMIPLLKELQGKLPVLFSDIVAEE